MCYQRVHICSNNDTNFASRTVGKAQDDVYNATLRRHHTVLCHHPPSADSAAFCGEHRRRSLSQAVLHRRIALTHNRQTHHLTPRFEECRRSLTRLSTQDLECGSVPCCRCCAAASQSADLLDRLHLLIFFSLRFLSLHIMSTLVSGVPDAAASARSRPPQPLQLSTGGCNSAASSSSAPPQRRSVAFSLVHLVAMMTVVATALLLGLPSRSQS